MNKHTPGPWVTDEKQEGDRYRYVFADGVPVARTCIFASKHAEANAALIAASPDLLAALEEAVLHIKAMSGRDNSFDPPEDVSYYEETIAKARGEA